MRGFIIFYFSAYCGPTMIFFLFLRDIREDDLLCSLFGSEDLSKLRSLISGWRRAIQVVHLPPSGSDHTKHATIKKDIKSL